MTVTVVDPVIIMTAGTDVTICPGECVTLDGDAYHQVSPASTPTFANNQFSPVISGTSSVNINVQGLNMSGLTTGSITQMCINNFTFSGSSVCLNLGGCPCNGGTVNFGQTCDLTPGSFVVTLNAPNGCGSITLVPSGVANGNYNNACFVPVGGAPFGPPFPAGGTWAPQEPFSGLDGCDPNGVWTLSFNAPGLGIGIGLLTGWNISFDDPEIQGPVIFSWDPTTNMTGDDTLTPTVCPDQNTTYTLTATNQAGCATNSASVTVTIEACCDLEVTDITTVPPSCGGGDGSITIAGITGQITGVNYALDGGPEQASATFDGLDPGTYVITVNDDNNCPVNVTVTLDAPVGPDLTALTITDPTCGLENGIIDVVATGNAPLQYSADGGFSFQASGLFEDLVDGDYDIVVQDANDCTTIVSVFLPPSAAPTIDDVATTPPACGVDDGSITIAATGNGLLYSIDAGISFQAGNAFTDLAAGTYTVVVQDADGCTADTNVSLNAIDGPEITDVTTLTSNCGQATGGLTVTAVGSGLQYSSDNGVSFQAGNTFTGLAAGTYTVVVEDNIGCQASLAVTVDETEQPTIDQVLTTDPTCAQANGQLVVQATGIDLFYSIDGGTSTQATGTFTDLAFGIYTVSVTSFGCTVTAPAQLIESLGPSIQAIEPLLPSCPGDGDGGLAVQASGDAPLQYSINGGASFQATPLFGGLAAGTYELVVIDVGGCTVEQSFPLNDPAPLGLQLTLVDPLCAGECTGSATVAVSGGTVTTGYTFLWSGGVAPTTAPQATALCPGSYSLTVLDNSGCTIDTAFTLVEPAPFVIDALAATDESCPQFCDGTLLASATGAAAYQLNNGAPQGSAFFGGLCPGTYTVTATSLAGCTAQATATVDPGAAVTAGFTADPLVNSVLTPNFSLTNTSTGASDYLWTFGTFTTSTATDPSITFPQNPAEYNVCLVASNQQGCEDVFCMTLVVEEEFAIHVPNAFTPNGDGLNDEFRVVGPPELTQDFRLEIFDRWGELIFTSLDIAQGWDGRYQGSLAMQGVYVWQLAIRDPRTAERRFWRGHVTLTR